MNKTQFETILQSKTNDLTHELKSAFDRIFENYQADLRAQRGFFSVEQRDLILNQALEKLFNCVSSTRPLVAQDIPTLWNQVCVDFHQNKYWGFYPSLKENPEKKPWIQWTPVERELFPYIWAFFQSAIAMKVIIYYFGIRASHDMSLANNLFVGFAILFSFSSLFFFAWRQHRKNK